MAFWNGATEPLRKNRWFMSAGALQEFTYALKKCDKPSYKTSEITHKFGNYNYYYPGRVEWNTINVTFASVPFLDGFVMNILKNAGFSQPTSEVNALKAPSKANFQANMQDIRILQQAWDGKQVIESWKLINPFFTNIKFGDLSYESEEIVDVELTIRFDTAFYNKDGSGNPVAGISAEVP